MEKSRTLGTNMVFVCYSLFKEAGIHINLICFDRNFDHPHISVVTFVPNKQSKSHSFFHQNIVFLCLKSLRYDVSVVRFVHTCPHGEIAALFEKLLLNCCTFETLTKKILFDCFGVKFVPPFFEKSQTFEMAKKLGKQGKHEHNFVIFSKAIRQTRHYNRAYHLSALVVIQGTAFNGPVMYLNDFYIYPTSVVYEYNYKA